jgi:hypothetical protein
MGYVENIKSIMQWGNSFERQDRFPLDRTDLHISYDDAVLYAKGDGSDSRGLGTLAYVGQTITVWGLNEKGVDGVWVYSLVPHTPVDENDNTLADLQPVGTGAGTETADNYSAAVALSNDLVVGQLIKVANDEVVDASGDSDDSDVTTTTYKAGIYIVDAPGVIYALGSSSDITNLEVKVDKDIQNLNNLIDDYSGTLSDVDDRLVELEEFVDSHAYHEFIPISEIEGLFGTQTEE